MVMVAKNANTCVICHAYSPESIRIAIENGVRGIEHGNLLGRETALLLAEKGCYLTPTLITFFQLAIRQSHISYLQTHAQRTSM